MNEIITNLHMHSTYSDGSLKPSEIIDIALDSILDCIILTDHNIRPFGIEGNYKKGKKQLLVITGEEIHNRQNEYTKDHLLVFGADEELSAHSENFDMIMQKARENNALAFIAHPYEDELVIFNEHAINWENWDLKGFTGIEIWNGLSELKTEASNLLKLLFYAFFPKFYPRGPHPKAIAKWDELLNMGEKIVAIGGSDAHALKINKFGLSHTVYPYITHFNMINNHILVEKPMGDDFKANRKNLLDAMKMGRLFIGFDLPSPTKGFRFYAQGLNQTAEMGDSIQLHNGITLQVKLPLPVECRLIKNGKPIKAWNNKEIISLIIKEPGIYRVVAYIPYYGKKRTWIISNPIFVKS